MYGKFNRLNNEIRLNGISLELGFSEKKLGCVDLVLRDFAVLKYFWLYLLMTKKKILG